MLVFPEYLTLRGQTGYMSKVWLSDEILERGNISWPSKYTCKLIIYHSIFQRFLYLPVLLIFLDRNSRL